MLAVTQSRYGGAEVLETREVERPEPGPGELRVRVLAAGIDAGEWHIMTGLPLLVRLFFGLRRPKQPIRGRDFSGVVEALGEGVSDFAVGDAVFGHASATYAEFCCVTTEQLVPKPERLSFEEAAVLPESGLTALDALGQVREIVPGQRILITGAGGGVGSFAVLLAKAKGLVVTAVCSGAKRDFVRSLGADDVVDYQQQDVGSLEERFDIVIDLAGRRPVSELRSILSERGTLVLVGGEGGGRLLGGIGRQLFASLLSMFRRQSIFAPISTERGAKRLLALLSALDAGVVRSPLVETYVLSDAARAMAGFAKGHSMGKLAIRVPGRGDSC